MSEALLDEERRTCCYPLRGDGVKFDLKEVLGRSKGPTVGRMSLQATSGTPLEGMSFDQNDLLLGSIERENVVGKKGCI